MSINVIPGTAQLPLNASQGFGAQEVDQFGTPLATQPTFTWSSSGPGSIDAASGVYSSGATATGTATVQAANGALTGTATVTVRHDAPVIVVAANASPTPVGAGGVATLNAYATSDLGQAALTYTWSTTGSTPAPVTFSGNGTNAAQNMPVTLTQPGAYPLQVTVTDTAGLSAVSAVIVTVAPLTAPSNVTATPGDGVVLITWTPVPGATGYTVYRLNGGSYTAVGWQVAGQTALIDPAVTNGNNYNYVVTASTDTLNSSYSAPAASATPQAQPGTWSIVYQPASDSATAPQFTAQTDTTASSANGSASASSEVQGAVTGGAVSAQAQASRAGSWTATWTPNASGAWPTLLVLTRDQISNYLVDVTSATGTASITSADGSIHISASMPPADAAGSLGPTNSESWNVADLTSPVRTKLRNQETRSSVTSSTGASIGWRHSFFQNTTSVTYYTGAFLHAHFTTPGVITLTLPAASIDMTSLVSVTAASDPHADASASALSSDKVSGN